MAAYTEDQILQSSDPVLSESNALVRLTAAEAAGTASAALIAANTAAIGGDGSDLGYTDATTTYTSADTEVQGAIKNIDTQVKANADDIAANHSSLDVGIVVTGAAGAVTIQAKDGAGANLAAAIPVEVIVWKSALGVLADGVTEAGMTVSTGTEDALNDASYASRKLITTDATGLIELSVEEKAGAAITFVLQVINRAGGVSPALAAVAFAGP